MDSREREVFNAIERYQPINCIHMSSIVPKVDVREVYIRNWTLQKNVVSLETNYYWNNDNIQLHYQSLNSIIELRSNEKVKRGAGLKEASYAANHCML